MRKSMFASFAALVLGASLALTGCKVGDDGGDDTGGSDNPGDEDGGDEDTGPDAAVAEPCPPSVEDFTADVFDAVLGPEGNRCTDCHASGIGGYTISLTDQAANLTATTNKAKKDFGGDPALLARPIGGGGHPLRFAEGSAEYQALETFVGQVTGAAGACD
jgi:hypothetical protein